MPLKLCLTHKRLGISFDVFLSMWECGDILYIGVFLFRFSWVSSLNLQGAGDGKGEGT